MSLSDTVGFIRDLPHKLVEAFQATLQEAADADLLLHVVDAASPLLPEQQAEVERVLHEIGADRRAADRSSTTSATCSRRRGVARSRSTGSSVRRASACRVCFVSAATAQGSTRCATC